MATVLDVGLLNFLTPAFVIVFVFVLMYAFLQKTKILGANKGLDGIVALSLSLLFIVTSPAVEFIKTITPWFVVIVFIILAMVTIFLFAGVKPENVAGAFSEHGTTTVILLLLLLAFVVVQVLGPTIRSVTTGEGVAEEEKVTFLATVGRIIVHPRVLGMFLILAIAQQLIRAIAKS